MESNGWTFKFRDRMNAKGISASMARYFHRRDLNTINPKYLLVIQRLSKYALGLNAQIINHAHFFFSFSPSLFFRGYVPSENKYSLVAYFNQNEEK